MKIQSKSVVIFRIDPNFHDKPPVAGIPVTRVSNVGSKLALPPPPVFIHLSTFIAVVTAMVAGSRRENQLANLRTCISCHTHMKSL